MHEIKYLVILFFLITLGFSAIQLDYNKYALGNTYVTASIDCAGNTTCISESNAYQLQCSVYEYICSQEAVGGCAWIELDNGVGNDKVTLYIGDSNYFPVDEKYKIHCYYDTYSEESYFKIKHYKVSEFDKFIIFLFPFYLVIVGALYLSEFIRNKELIISIGVYLAMFYYIFAILQYPFLNIVTVLFILVGVLLIILGFYRRSLNYMLKKNR